MPHDDVKLQKCVRLALQGQEPNHQLLRQLANYVCSSSTPTLGARSCSVRKAAGTIHGLPSNIVQLSKTIAGSGVFRLHQNKHGDTIIQLDADALVQRAKQATTTGILIAELPEAAGFVDDVHPIRPGQRNCVQWMKFAECKFGKGCVFNHPDLASSHRTSFSSSRSDTTAHAPAGLQAKHPAALRTSSSTSRSSSSSLDHTTPAIHLSNTPGSVSYSAAMTGHGQHTGAASTSTTAAGALLHSTSPPEAVQLPAAEGSASSDGLIGTSMPGRMAPPGAAAAAAASQSELSSNPVLPAPPTASPPAAATAVCPMFLMRGICLSGPRCPYSHPARGSQIASSDLPATPSTVSAAPTASTTAAAALKPVAAALHAAAPTAPAVPHLHAPAAAAAEVGVCSSASQQQQQLAERQQQPRSWQQVVSQPQQQGEQNHRSQQDLEKFTWQQQQLAAHQQELNDARAVKQHHFKAVPLPITGQTPEGLPHRPGAANCSFYMHTGTCKFKQQCLYHHPDYAAHPINYVKNGFSAAKWPSTRSVPYFRLIMHLSRIWEYESCPEAQLKTWMAHHLISAANPNCKMWHKSAARSVVQDDGCAHSSSSSHADTGSPFGRYSCDLSRAGEYLKMMWLEQPDEAAATSPMPYSQKLRSLFSTDPYFQVEAGPHNSSQFFLKLNVAKLIETLNW